MFRIHVSSLFGCLPVSPWLWVANGSEAAVAGPTGRLQKSKIQTGNGTFVLRILSYYSLATEPAFINNEAMRVSVVIRNRNESQYLRLTLEALKRQEYPDIEILLVDNNSTDNSVALAIEFGVKVFPIDNFTYGRALNKGISHATGEIIVILSAHSVPVGHHFISECVRPFSNPKVAAARCTYAGKRADDCRWINPELLSYPIEYSEASAKGPLASGCAIRRSVWEQIPFDETVPAAEEKIWAMEVMKRGHLIYSSVPAVYQYIKHLSASQNLRKQNREYLARFRYYGVPAGFTYSVIKSGLAESFRALFISGPSAFFSAVRTPVLRSWLLLLIPLNLFKKQKGF